MNPEALFDDDQLDDEWAQYVASMQQTESRRDLEKKSIVKREQETMQNLQRHIRGLSRARFVLADAVSSDLFDDISSDDLNEDSPTQECEISDMLHDLDLNPKSETSDSEIEGVAPLPIHTSVHRSFSRRTSRHIRSGVSPHSQSSQLSCLL